MTLERMIKKNSRWLILVKCWKITDRERNLVFRIPWCRLKTSCLSMTKRLWHWSISSTKKMETTPNLFKIRSRIITTLVSCNRTNQTSFITRNHNTFLIPSKIILKNTPEKKVIRPNKKIKGRLSSWMHKLVMLRLKLCFVCGRLREVVSWWNKKRLVLIMMRSLTDLRL